MRFHAPSFFAGFATGVALRRVNQRLRPVAVELSALGVHLARRARGALGRERESLEDMLAEIQERVRQRAKGASKTSRRPTPPSPARAPN